MNSLSKNVPNQKFSSLINTEFSEDYIKTSDFGKSKKEKYMDLEENIKSVDFNNLKQFLE